MKPCPIAGRWAAVILLAGLTVPRAADAQVGRNLGALEPNLATKEQLLAVPGIDAALADALIAGRPYMDMLALDKVIGAGLSGERKAAVYAKLWIPLNLNTASREEILLVPGVGARMLREFLEYRPYAALAQFHREIGKYVDDQELARLEQYVYVPIDLNTASDEEILTIPGVGNRMLREFKEYRPWRSLEQFRREIGKYVSNDEVARLERYVTIKPGA
jgi:DNA uptake protein ComE-like DNA-binding protein